MRVLLAIFMTLVLFLTGPLMELALAAPKAGSPVVSGRLKGDYARITFAWPQAVKFKTAMAGNTLTITFEKPLLSSPGDALAGLAPYIEKTTLSADKRSVMLKLNQPYPIRSFVSGTSAGVDVMKIASRPVIKKPEAEPQPTQQTAATTSPKDEKPAEKAPFALQQPPAMTKPAPVPVAKPAAPVATAKATAAAPKKPAPTPTPKQTAKVNAPLPAAKPTPPAKTAEVAKASPPAVAEKKVAEKESPPAAAKEEPAKTEEETAAPEKEKTEEAPAKETAQEEKKDEKKPGKRQIDVVEKTAVSGKQMMVTVHKRNVDAELYFPWKERAASAVFTRGPYLWVIFDRPTPINLQSLTTILPDYIPEVEAMDYPGYTVLRFTTTSPVYAAARHRRGTYEWIVTVSRRGIIPAFPVVIEPRSTPPLKPNVMVNLLQTTEPLTLIDPALGDALEVIPTHGDGKGVFPERRFVDFQLLRTAQGLVVKKLNDATRIAKLRNGLRIALPGDGVTLTASLPPLNLDQFIEAEANSNTFFPYDRWHTEDAVAFYAKKHMLQNQIVRANDQKASVLRTELAQMLLAEGYHHEAIGVLNQIKRLDPEYYEIYQLAALRGAANFMIDRVAEANLDFSDPSLEDEEEIELWKRATSVMMGNEKKLIRFLHFEPQYISHYPPDMRQKLTIIAADQLIGRHRYKEFNKVLETLQADGQLNTIGDQADYMIGRMLADSGSNDEAVAVFTKLIDTTKNRFVQVRAEFALATLEYETGKINRLQLIDKLDRLRYIWRGDALELGILNLLGDLNNLEGRYPEALRAWKEIITNYPGTQQASDVASKMAVAFVKLFNEGQADKMEPLQALALYDEFRELTPVGTAGDKMIQNLADRLAGVDLLDRAAALLSHQVKYRLEKEERSRVGARLGLIYLFNREPRKALEVLELTGYGALPPELQLQRNHLAAMAYNDIGDWKTALDMLKDDYSDEAKKIRLDVFWDNKNWKNVVASAEDILASRKDITAPLSEAEAQTLIRLAVAYTFEGDSLQLQYLRDYFSPLLEGNPLKPRFMFISNDTGPIDPKNMASFEQEITDIKSYLDTYRQQVQEKGLSSIN